jgi:hypothetical protein
MAGFQEVATDEARREQMKQSTNIFRVLVKTLWNAGIITDRTRHLYEAWVDLGELGREPEGVVGDAIADAAILELREINSGKKKIGRAMKEIARAN